MNSQTKGLDFWRVMEAIKILGGSTTPREDEQKLKERLAELVKHERMLWDKDGVSDMGELRERRTKVKWVLAIVRLARGSL